MAIEVRTQETNPAVKVVLFSGRLDATVTETTLPAMLKALEQSAAGMILDLTKVDFISSAGLRMVLEARKKAVAAGKKIALIRAHPAVYKIFKVSALDRLLPFFEDEDEAVQALWP